MFIFYIHKCRNRRLKTKMEVKAISTPNFSGRIYNKKENKKHQAPQDYPQISAPASQQSSKAMRDLMVGLMALGAATTTLSSCEPDVTASASAADSSSAVAIGGGWHHKDTVTIIKRDTINQTDTVIHTIIKPINVKEYPFNLGDSLIAQGKNIGVPIDGPQPNGSGKDNVVYLGSKAHNRYDNKFYESMIDSVGTNRRELSIVSKIVDMYDAENPKTSYMKTVVTDVPGRGIKLTRYVTNSETKPTDKEEYLWNYAGYEVRTNGRDGRRNVRSIFDNNNKLVYKGDYEKGENPGTFLYGALIYDENTGDVIKDDSGEPEFAQYDFDQAVIYSDYAKTFYVPGWNYGE